MCGATEAAVAVGSVTELSAQQPLAMATLAQQPLATPAQQPLAMATPAQQPLAMPAQQPLATPAPSAGLRAAGEPAEETKRASRRGGKGSGDCGAFGVIVLVGSAEKVIVTCQLRRGERSWELPKGGIEVGDGSAEMTAARELREETGLTNQLELMPLPRTTQRGRTGWFVAHVADECELQWAEVTDKDTIDVRCMQLCEAERGSSFSSEYADGECRWRMPMANADGECKGSGTDLGRHRNCLDEIASLGAFRSARPLSVRRRNSEIFSKKSTLRPSRCCEMTTSSC